jgi:hypothetical protein
VILYAWTAVAAGSAEYGGSLGVSDDSERARLAAEPYLRSGLARLAYVESVHTVMSAHAESALRADRGGLVGDTGCSAGRCGVGAVHRSGYGGWSPGAGRIGRLRR